MTKQTLGNSSQDPISKIPNTKKKGWFKSPVPLKNKNKFETSLGNLARPRLKNKIKSGHQ
jgi:hypothetical protein